MDKVNQQPLSQNINVEGQSSSSSIFSSWTVRIIIIAIVLYALSQYFENWCKKPKKGETQSPVCKVANAVADVVKTVSKIVSNVVFEILALVGVAGYFGSSALKNRGKDGGDGDNGDGGGDDGNGDDDGNGNGDDGGNGEIIEDFPGHASIYENFYKK